MKMIKMYEWAVVLGAVAGNHWLVYKNHIYIFSSFILIGFGLAGGTFVGMMAAGLTEVLECVADIGKTNWS